MIEMKKRLSMVMAVVMVGMILLSGCSLVEFFSPQAYGVILYGKPGLSTANEADLQQKDVDWSRVYETKVSDNTLLLRASDVKELAQEQLINEVKDNDQLVNIPVYEPQQLPESWAKTSGTQPHMTGMELHYRGNIIIGDGRAVAENFIVLEDQQFAALEAPKSEMLVIRFNENPKTFLAELKGDTRQLTSIR